MLQHTFYTSIASSYVPDWGLWEAIRELLQNAMDQDPNYTVEHSNDTLTITTHNTKLSRNTLLLGVSNKPTGSIGKYGEGYKLACLVLLRLGYKVCINTNQEQWYPRLDIHSQLNHEVLVFDFVEVSAYSNDITFTVKIPKEDYESVSDKFVNPKDYQVIAEHSGNYIFNQSDEQYDLNNLNTLKSIEPKVYVNGLFVCNLPSQYMFSYSLTPSCIKLDRDRDHVREFELQEQVCKILESSLNFNLIYQLTKIKAPDLYEYFYPDTYSYVTVGGVTASPSEHLCKIATKAYINNYGLNSLPISDDNTGIKLEAYYKLAKKLNLTPVLVPRNLYKLLNNTLKSPVASFIKSVPSFSYNTITAISQFAELNKKLMNKKVKRNLEELIIALQIKE